MGSRMPVSERQKKLDSPCAIGENATRRMGVVGLLMRAYRLWVIAIIIIIMAYDLTRLFLSVILGT